MRVYFRGMAIYVREATILKKDDNIYFGIGIVIVGIPYLMFFRNTSFIIASAFVIHFAIMLPYFRNKIAMRKLKNTDQNAFLSFYPTCIDLNGKKIELFAGKKWIKLMHIIENVRGLPPLLEIEIAWRTRNGDTFDETRVPIPKGQM